MPVIELRADAQMSPSGVFVPPEESPLVSTGPIRWPLEMQFGGPLDRGLRFKRPLPVQAYRDGLTYVVDCQLLEQFGCGLNMSEALDDFGKTISEMYFSLDEENASDRLGDTLARQFQALQEFIELRPKTA